MLHVMPGIRYLVTGGAGFIGSHLTEALVARGERVRVVDNLATGRTENLHAFTNKIEFIQGDLLDESVRQKALAGVEVVFHLAALGSVPRSIENPEATHLAGAHATFLLLDAARKAGVRRLIHASSSSVYGDTVVLPKVETMPLAPRSPYAASKAACEHYVRAFALVYALDTVALRYFNVFGPRQNPHSPYSAVIAKFCQAYAGCGEIHIHGDGAQSRDFTFVQNAVQANLLAADCPKGLEGQAINVACGERHSLNEMVALLNEISGQKKVAQHGPDRAGDVKHSLADLARARDLLGYRPVVDFKTGLARTLEWYSKGQS